MVALAVTAVAAMAGVWVVAVFDAVAGALVAGDRIRWRVLVATPLRRAALLATQQGGRTEHPDAQAWALAPALLGGLAASALAVTLVGPRSAVADAATGFVLFAAAVALVMVAVFLHGWSPNAAFPLIGAYRFAAAALSFQIPFLLAMLATALPAESLAVGDIIRAQQGQWNVVRQPLGLPIYLVVGVGAAFWGPLGFPDAPDLASGTMAEVAGPARLLWAVAQSALLVAVAVMGAASFLGGWWGPVVPGPVWIVLKSAALLAALVASRHLLARVRLERFVVVAWVILIPLALLNVFVSGVFLL